MDPYDHGPLGAAIYYCLKDLGPQTTVEVARRVGRSRSWTSRYLRQMVADGTIFRQKKEGERQMCVYAHQLGDRPCSICAEPCTTGRYCPECKQRFRRDRLRFQAAIALAEEDHLSGREVSPTLLASKLRVPLWDFRDREDRQQEGLVSHLLRRGFLSDEWAHRARNAVGSD